MEVVKVADAPTPGPDGLSEIGVANATAGLALALRFDPSALPRAAVWLALRPGIFALGLEPQTMLDDDAPLPPGAHRDYRLDIELSDPA